MNLAEIESEVFLLGHWKNYDDLENSLSMPEMLATLDAARKVQDRTHKMMAAVQGIDLDGPGTDETDFKEIERRAAARIAGIKVGDNGNFDVVDEIGKGGGIDYEVLTD